jgi:hypothetical protein
MVLPFFVLFGISPMMNADLAIDACCSLEL